MTRVDQILKRYHADHSNEDRFAQTKRLIELSLDDSYALNALLHVLNGENDSGIRLAIVQHLESTRPRAASGALAKAMFDPDPLIRAHAALALSEYDDVWLLASSLAPLMDALPDPATRAPAERAIQRVAGKPSDKITVSERARIRLGEHPRTLWPHYYLTLPAPH